MFTFAEFYIFNYLGKVVYRVIVLYCVKCNYIETKAACRHIIPSPTFSGDDLCGYRFPPVDGTRNP